MKDCYPHFVDDSRGIAIERRKVPLRPHCTMGLLFFDKLFLIGLDKMVRAGHNATMFRLFFQKRVKRSGTAAEFEIRAVRSQLMQLKQKGLAIPVFTIKI